MTDQEQQNTEPTTPTETPTQDAENKIETVVNEVTGKDLSEEVQNFVSAGKKLLDSIFSELTGRFENKIKQYISNLTK